MAEFVKLCLSLISLYKMYGFEQSEKQLRSCFKKGGEGYLIPRVATLAGLYCLNNHLEFLLYTIFSPSFISLVKAAMPVLIAVFSMGRGVANLHISQLLNLIIACLSLFCAKYTPVTDSSESATTGMGWLFLLTHVSIAALNGVWNENSLTACSASLNAHNTFLYGFGSLFNLIGFVFSSEKRGFFQGYDAAGLTVIFVNSIVGLAISGVYKFLGAVAGSLANSTSAVLVLFISYKFLGYQLSINGLLNSIITVFAIGLHFLSVNRQFDIFVGVDAAKENQNIAQQASPRKKGNIETRKLLMATVIPVTVASLAVTGTLSV